MTKCRCSKEMFIIELVTSDMTLYSHFRCVFRNHHKKTNLTIYNMTIFGKNHNFPIFLGGTNWVFGPRANKKICPRKLGWQKTVFVSLQTILSENNIKFHMYLMSNIMEEFQFSRSFDLRKLCNMSVEVYIFMKALTMKKLSYTLRRVRILQHWTKP